jgi:hypothetical protein
LSDIPLIPSSIPPISIYYDFRAALNFKKKKENKHIKRRQKLARQQNNRETSSLKFIKSEQNIVGCPTKGLNMEKA